MPPHPCVAYPNTRPHNKNDVFIEDILEEINHFFGLSSTKAKIVIIFNLFTQAGAIIKAIS